MHGGRHKAGRVPYDVLLWRYSEKFWTVTGCGNYTKGSVVRRECGVGDRNISHFSPAIPVSAHREGNVCSSFSPSHHAPVWLTKAGIFGIIFEQRVLLYLEKKWVCPASFFCFLYPLIAGLSYLLFKFFFTYHRARALLHFLSWDRRKSGLAVGQVA